MLKAFGGMTQLLLSDREPEVVMGPPDKPFPAETKVTVPVARPVALIVTTPVPPEGERAMFEPATIWVTPPPPPPPVAVMVVTVPTVLRAIPTPAASTAPASFDKVGMVEVFRLIPAPIATGKYGPFTYGLSGAKKGLFGMGIFGFCGGLGRAIYHYTIET